MIVDTILVYQFIKKLITPFDQMKAFERGLIDEKGNFLKKRKYFSPEDKQVLGLFDVMVINLKKLIAKVPGGGTKIATIAAALLLLRSDPKKLKEETITDELFNLEEEFNITIRELQLIEDGSAAVNSTAGVAGLSANSIGVPRSAANRYKNNNAKAAPQKKNAKNKKSTIVKDVVHAVLRTAGIPTSPIKMAKSGMMDSLGLTRR